MKKIIINKKIVPCKLICNKKFYKIDVTNSIYNIEEFIINVNEDDKIENIIITKGKHPNCDSVSKEFCIPEYLKDFKLNTEVLKIIENMIKVFNFDSAYYQPWNDFVIKEEGVVNNG